MSGFSTELNQSILDSAPDAMVIVDGEGTILFANQQVSALFGHAAADIVGQPIETLIPERFHGRHVGHRESYGSGMKVRPMGTGLGLFALRNDGSEFPVEISLSPVRDGARSLVAAAIRDVTDRKRVEAERVAAREAADRANQAKSRFLAAASHDLRQPLQTLAMLNGTLQRLVRDPAASDAVAHQGQAIAAMSRLLNSLLDISKLESGAVRPEITDFRVAGVFEELRIEFASLATSKGLELRIDQCADCVHSDPSLVAQILKNLLANAIKYTREGCVQLRCLHEHSLVRIEVLDTGVGIAPEQMRHIFDEFYQVGVSPNTTRDGYGLGLSIVDRLVRLLDVRLDVQSEVGKGSSFALELPAGDRPDLAGAGVAYRPTPAAATVPAHVLLVEDDAAVRNATQMLLRAEGFRVTAVGSAADAVGNVRQMPTPPDIVLTDYHLADGETGLQVITALRGIVGDAVKAVLITGDTSSAAREIGRDNRLRVVSKPVDADNLLAILRQLMRAS